MDSRRIILIAEASHGIGTALVDTIPGVDAVLFPTEAPHITGEVLHVDGGTHAGKW